MARPLTFLVLVCAVACAALFLLLPLSKIAQHPDRGELATPPLLSPEPDAIAVAAPGEAQHQQAATVIDTPAPAAERALTVMVSGRVGDTSGAPLADREIEFENRGFDGAEVTRSRVVSDALGNFSLPLVPGRRYQLSIAAAGDYAGYRLEDFTDSTAEGLRNILLERVELVDVDGMIVDTNYSPVADFELGLRHLTLEYPNLSIRTDSSGYFSLRRIPAGAWRIASDQSDYYRIKGVELRAGEYRNLTLMIDRGDYYLSGWVRDTDGIPVAQAVITLKSAFAAEGYHSFSYRSLGTDDNGAFAFDQLGGHPLTLGVYAPGYKTLVRQHRFNSFADNIDLVLTRE
jgi:hypothetical protein